MIKAVIFDVDGVLVDSREANIHIYQQLMKKAGYEPPSRELILECFHIALKPSLIKMTGTDDEEEIERIIGLIDEPGVREPQLMQFPLVLESTLQELHTKYKLAIVTSRIRSGVDEVFSQRKISHLFDAVVTYEDYQNPKPHPEPLLVALRKLNLHPEEAIYIGDGEGDIEAARDAGMKSIHLATKKHPDATAAAKEFAELLEVIELLVST